METTITRLEIGEGFFVARLSDGRSLQATTVRSLLAEISKELGKQSAYRAGISILKALSARGGQG